MIIKHNLTLDRIFKNSHQLEAADVEPGENFHIQMNPRRLFWAGWWAFGGLDGDGGLRGKKFTRLEQDGSIDTLMPGEQAGRYSVKGLRTWRLQRTRKMVVSLLSLLSRSKYSMSSVDLFSF